MHKSRSQSVKRKPESLSSQDTSFTEGKASDPFLYISFKTSDIMVPLFKTLMRVWTCCMVPREPQEACRTY